VQKKYNTASMIISHDMSCIHATANRIVMLIDGKCYANDTYEKLMQSSDQKIRDFFIETI
jgi:phospholipid/cholesterol/gamma-HCH transport system ATP-binding protein